MGFFVLNKRGKISTPLPPSRSSSLNGVLDPSTNGERVRLWGGSGSGIKVEVLWRPETVWRGGGNGGDLRFGGIGRDRNGTVGGLTGGTEVRSEGW